MKGQQLFHSFLPGVTAAVLTTQPAWASTVKVSGVQLASSPTVSTSAFGRTLAAETMNPQQFNTTGDNSSALVTVPGLTKLSVNPVSNLSFPEIMTGNTAVPTEQVSRKDEGRFSSLPLTADPSHIIDGNRSVESQQKQSKLPSYGQKLESSRSIISSVPKETSRMSSSQQPVVQKQKPDKQLQTVLPNSVTGAGIAKLLASHRCLQNESPKLTTSSASLLLASRACSQQNVTGKKLAQSSTPTRSENVTPAPAGSVTIPTTSGNVTPAPTGSVPIPENLNPSPNPLQFPTKTEEVTLQGNQPITLAQALELAKRNNRDLQVSILELERTQAALREAQAALFPSFDLNTNISHGRSAGNTLTAKQADTTAPDNTTFTGQAELSYNIYTSGRREATIKQAEEQVRFNELAVESRSEDIRLNVAREYYDLQQADEQVRITQSAVENAQASLRDAQALERAGVGTRFDVLRSQVNLANSQQELTNALGQQQIARRRLATRLSLPQSVNISAADPVQLAGLWNQSLEQSIVLAYQNRPELQQQLAQRNINEQQRRQALAALGPQVSLVANYDLLDQFDDGFNVSDGYSVGVRATLNLFDGGAAKARASQARANIAIAETQFSEQRNQIRFQVEQAFSNQLSNLENVQTSNTALEQAREALRLARLRFQAGVGTQTDVINAENDLTRSEGNRIRAILDYNRALTDLQRYVTSRALNK
ncbi:outer membrane protein [Cylindrospermum stagnale PCC 7417]|uniref:Outer membrane protein n=1 Tax=Cylindrospermum stagnale PCC 7417 TaxID=56107 RepID=K9X137_9NOST|nr:TolC family protein [Cylindrospermum stagnale]AFZ25462.1 outer membrane protein [Cylindrospermum stagnale PCC 7417]